MPIPVAKVGGSRKVRLIKGSLLLLPLGAAAVWAGAINPGWLRSHDNRPDPPTIPRTVRLSLFAGDKDVPWGDSAGRVTEGSLALGQEKGVVWTYAIRIGGGRVKPALLECEGELADTNHTLAVASHAYADPADEESGADAASLLCGSSTHPLSFVVSEASGHTVLETGDGVRRLLWVAVR